MEFNKVLNLSPVVVGLGRYTDDGLAFFHLFFLFLYRFPYCISADIFSIIYTFWMGLALLVLLLE